MVNEEGNIIETGENLVITSANSIAHCEIVLINKLAGNNDFAVLNKCTLYATTEPCPMCSAALFWSGIGKIVYALSKEGYHTIAKTTNPNHLFNISSRQVLGYAGRKTEVVGPLMENEAKAIYEKWLT